MRLSDAFARARDESRSLLVGFVTGGDPSPDSTPKIARALVDGGVDVIELGIPFSDPIADGPSIQASSARALRNGVTSKMVLEMAEEISSDLDVPVAILTYFNSIFNMGVEEFLAIAAKSNVAGIVVPDLPPEESNEYGKSAIEREIDTMYLATPATPDERLEKIIKSTTGFLYLVTLFGVTGARNNFDEYSREVTRRFVSKVSGRVPLAVGFGISRPEHVRLFTDLGVDGVIVGSALVNIIERNIGDDLKMISELEQLSKDLRSATKLL